MAPQNSILYPWPPFNVLFPPGGPLGPRLGTPEVQDGSFHILPRVNRFALKYLNERKQKKNHLTSDRTSREMSTTLSNNFEFTESPMLIDHNGSSTVQ